MVTYGEITKKTVTAPFTKTDLEGYVIAGEATFNINHALIDGNGEIMTADTDEHLAHFNIYGGGAATRLTIDAPVEIMDEMQTIVKATLEDLSNNHPAE